MEPATFATEENYWSQGKKFVAGLDEVGRGAWAGPSAIHRRSFAHIGSSAK